MRHCNLFRGRDFEGKWVRLNWPFARLMIIRISAGLKMRVKFFDVEYEVAERLLNGEKCKYCSKDAFYVEDVDFANNARLLLRVRYHGARTGVDYVFFAPKKTHMHALCSWDERFVNLSHEIDADTECPIAGNWRYEELDYTSLIINVYRESNGHLRLKVNNTVGKKGSVGIMPMKISDDEVVFRTKKNCMQYQLSSKDGVSAMCKCTNLQEVWMRCPVI